MGGKEYGTKQSDEMDAHEMMERDETYISFFFNDTATTEIYTLSLHDALPI